MGCGRMLTTGRIGIGILSAALLPMASFRAVSAGRVTLAETVEAAQQTAAPSAPITVSDVSIQAGGGGEAFVDVSTSRSATYRVLQLKDPDRLVVDLDGANKGTPRELYQAKSGLLKSVRVAQYRGKNPAVVRVVVDLKGDPTFDVHATPSGIRIELKPRQLAQMSGAPVLNGAHPPGAAPAQRPNPPPPSPPGQLATQQQAAMVAAAVAQAPPQPMPGAQVQPVSQPMMQGPVIPFYRNLPSRSLDQNEKLLDSLGLKIMLGYNYGRGGPDEAAWKTKAAPGVEASRLFIRPTGPGSYRTLELAIAPSAQSGYDLVVYGQQVVQSSTGPNPDFPAIQQLVNEEVGKIEQAPPPADLLNLSYQTYNLSYVTADRALALLKTLGYTTVEYNGQAGEALFQTIYNPVKLGTGRPPIIVKLINSTKTSITEPAPAGAAGAAQAGAPPAGAMPGNQAMGAGGVSPSGVPQIAGTYLHQMTSGEPQERFLILYDKNDPDSLQALINVLHTTVDVASRQIMIEALVIELNANKTLNFGVNFETVQNGVDVANAGLGASGTAQAGQPLSIFTFTKGAPNIATFTASLQAYLQRGDAQVLSNPSVLVLDDRQARIQIGEQVPVSQAESNLGTTFSSVSYFPVGIVLNLRPRINEDGSEITMQTEAIVSAISTAIIPGAAVGAPVVNNREVQSIVRIADNTPFIIGGLISTNNTRSVTGIPFLSDIPLLGNLFRSTSFTKTKQEVIIVITPHVVPLVDKYFSYVIPKDSAQFDRFDYQLFRNAYRVRGSDLFDLGFIYDSDVYKQLVKRVKEASANNPELKNDAPFATVLKDGAPGEDILVRRMLWEIIDKTNYARYVNPEQIVFPENNLAAVGGAGWQIQKLSPLLKNMKHDHEGLALTFEAQAQGTAERPFAPPKAVVSYPNVTAQTCANSLINGNAPNPDGMPLNWMILLTNSDCPPITPRVTTFKLLQEVLVLRRLLELNKDVPLTIKDFHIGRQIVFPSQEELQQGNPFVDREVAKLFYEVFNYYPAFEQEFNREAHYINAKLDGAHKP